MTHAPAATKVLPVLLLPACRRNTGAVLPRVLGSCGQVICQAGGPAAAATAPAAPTTAPTAPATPTAGRCLLPGVVNLLWDTQVVQVQARARECSAAVQRHTVQAARQQEGGVCVPTARLQADSSWQTSLHAHALLANTHSPFLLQLVQPSSAPPPKKPTCSALARGPVLTPGTWLPMASRE